MALLIKHKTLFNGQLGTWKGRPVNIELKPEAKLYYAKAYKVAHIYEQTFKKELERLREIGALRRVNHSPWAAPTFIRPPV